MDLLDQATATYPTLAKTWADAGLKNRAVEHGINVDFDLGASSAPCSRLPSMSLSTGMYFQGLGPLRARLDGHPVDLPGRNPSLVLGALLLVPDQSVDAEQLIELVWGPERGTLAALHTTVFRLRTWLRDRLAGAISLERGPAGYQLCVEPESVDVVQFRAMVAERGADPAERRARLAAALNLWRGPVLGNAAEWLHTHKAVAELNQDRVAAARELAEACERDGCPDLAVGHLLRVAEANPFDEPLHALALRALIAAGRTAEAAITYAELRARLAEELGVLPSAELQLLHEQISAAQPVTSRLNNRPPPSSSPPPPAASAPYPAADRVVVVRPAMLPAGLADFSGRTEQVELLTQRLSEKVREGVPVDSETGAPVVAAIAGMGGVGKTTLAVQVAHMIESRYPDGQLFVNLRGVQASPLDPGDVLAWFLRSLGVDGRAIPPDLSQRAEMYRSHLAGRRMLVVLDNAASEQQVRPLLPGSATCAVVVTSRARLTGLEGTIQLALDVFTHDEATFLLSRIVDEQRLTAKPHAVAELTRLCGGLPLAVRITGARLVARPTWQLADLIRILGDEHRRLDGLATGDLAVRASLAFSYDGLGEAPRRLFRLLGLLDVPDFPAWMTAALLDQPLVQATRCAEMLVDAQLLATEGTDAIGQSRYRFHDLVRLFARERAHQENSAEENGRAVERGLGAWLVIAERMALQVPGPCYSAISSPAPRYLILQAQEGPLKVDPASWFDVERQVLLSLIQQASDLDLDDFAFDLAGCMEKYFDLRGMYDDWVQTNTRVLALCQKTGNLLGEAVMRRGLIDVCTWSAAAEDDEVMARSHLEAGRVVELFGRLGHKPGLSDVTVLCSWALTAKGAYSEALRSAAEALRLAEESGHLGGEARAHMAMTVAYADQGRYGAALPHLAAALERALVLDNPRYIATVLQFSGIAHRELGNLELSERMFTESLAITRRHGDDYTETFTLVALGRLYLKRADPRARTVADSALVLARKYYLNHHAADALGTLGEVELAAGRPDLAIVYLEESVALWRTRGWMSFLADALVSLASAYAAGDPDAARRCLREARDLFERLDSRQRFDDAVRLLDCAGDQAG